MPSLWKRVEGNGRDMPILAACLSPCSASQPDRPSSRRGLNGTTRSSTTAFASASSAMASRPTDHAWRLSRPAEVCERTTMEGRSSRRMRTLTQMARSRFVGWSDRTRGAQQTPSMGRCALASDGLPLGLIAKWMIGLVYGLSVSPLPGSMLRPLTMAAIIALALH
jgi:hypothetical protein